MEESVIKRVMPNSLEAEQSVIGSMIMDREAVMAAFRDFNNRRFLPQAVWDTL